jgi:hypothetical protein
MRVLHAWNRWRVGGAAGVLLGALLLAVLTTENALPADAEAKAAALPSDLAKIPSDGYMAVSVRIADPWLGDLLKSMRQKHPKEIEFVLTEFKKYIGLSLEQMERTTMVLLDPISSKGDQLFFLRTVEPYDLAKVLAAHKNMKANKYKDQTFYAADEKSWAVYPLDNRSLVFAKFNDIRILIDHPQPEREGRLAGALRMAAGKHAMVYAMNVKMFNDAVGDKLPGEVDPFRPLLQAQWNSVVVDLGKKSRVETALYFDSEKDAKAAIKPGQTGLTLLRAGVKSGIAELGKEKDAKSIVELLERFQEPLKATKIEQQGKTLRAAVSVEIDPDLLGSTFVQTVQQMNASNKRREESLNLRLIAFVMQNYADSNGGRLPAQATYDKNGKPMLSWRVMILPYIEQVDLYNQFHLDEPWDSEHNKKLLAKMPKTYLSPQQDEKSIEEHLTYYQGFVGKGAFFEGKKGLRFPADFPDGTSQTIMIVEASKGVPWTKPEDIPYDADKPLPKLGLPGSTSYLAALCDGSVRTITPKLTERTLRAAITRNDGLPLGPDW